MNLRIIFSIIVILVSASLSFGQRVNWAKRIDPLKPENSDISATAIKGDFLYAFGHSDGEVILDVTLPQDKISRGYFLAKFDLEGALIWSKEIPVVYSEEKKWNQLLFDLENSIVVDNSGLIYVSGNFKGKLTFQGKTENIEIDADEGLDFTQIGNGYLPFIAKFDHALFQLPILFRVC